jgi:CBS domain-containing membrane protein
MPTTTVREIMTSVVETLSVGDTLAAARRQLERGRIRHLPVVDGDEHVIGLLTYRKILEAWVSHGHPNQERPREVARDVPIEMLMEKNVLTIGPDQPAAEAAALLEGHKLGCLPVVEGGKLVGIVTEADFVRFARRFFEWEMHGDARRAGLPG